jgi:hypothetical protein
MPKLTHKGIDSPPRAIVEQIPALFNWLSQLQLVMPNINTYEESINLASISAGTYSTQTFTITGLTTADVAIVNPPALTTGLYLISYYISASDTLSLTFYNSTGGAINETPNTYKIMTCKL